MKLSKLTLAIAYGFLSAVLVLALFFLLISLFIWIVSNTDPVVLGVFMLIFSFGVLFSIIFYKGFGE